jgi:hypothetical protein
MAEKPQYTNADLARGAFGFMIILTVLWAVGSVIYSNFFGTTFSWFNSFAPLTTVLLVQTILIWLHAVIKSAVSEGFVMGITIHQIQEEARKSRTN